MVRPVRLAYQEGTCHAPSRGNARHGIMGDDAGGGAVHVAQARSGDATREVSAPVDHGSFGSGAGALPRNKTGRSRLAQPALRVYRGD